ncbi:MAG: hypothetical protein IJ995_03095 [Clostridia bacterium]|nr:hypothetical protein [Clostridia bacterium]
MIKCKFSNVSERDMDLLFLEEVVSSNQFLGMFLKRIGLEDATVVEIEHSKMDAESGESDMTVIVEKNSVRYGLLIEDKIDAIAMENQSGRYIERGEKGKKNGDYSTYFTFIIAPKKYLEDNAEAQKYQYKISYEECLEYFKNKNDDRSQFKVQQIKQAIEKKKSGYQVTKNEAVTEFWNKYIDYQEENNPQLLLISKRGDKGFASRWPYFHTVVDELYIYHKSEQGVVDMVIDKAADKTVLIEEALVQLLGDLKENNLLVLKTGKAAAIRIKVPKIDFALPFEIYNKEIQICFKNIEKLADIAKRLSKEKIFLELMKNIKEK